MGDAQMRLQPVAMFDPDSGEHHPILIPSEQERTMTFKLDFMRRHAEALRERRPMEPPAIRVKLLHEQERGK